MDEEAVETGANTRPVPTVAAEPEPEVDPEPPSRRSGAGSTTNLYTLLGIGFALLAAGAYFFLFLRPAQLRALAEVARFTTVEGDVNVKPTDTQQWTAAREKMSLRSQDVVRTARQAGALLTFKTGNEVRLRSDSVVLIGEGVDNSEAMRLQSGQVNFDAARGTEIATGTATTKTSANSKGNVRVEAGGATGIKIFQGSAEVSTLGGDKLTLKENEAVKVDEKGKAGPKLNLPTAPNTLAPPTQAEIALKKPPESSVRLEWRPGGVAGATYRVAMDYNVVQADLLLSAALDEPGIRESHHDLKGLDTGKYYWRVAGVTEDGEEGQYSRVSSFAIVPAVEPASPPPAQVRIDSLEVMGAVVALKGRVAPGSAITVDGVPIEVGADGAFSEFLKKGGRRELTIKVTGPDGAVTEEKRPLS